MAGNANQKLKLLYLLQILESETDEENPIKTTDILRRLIVTSTVCVRLDTILFRLRVAAIFSVKDGLN